MPSPESKAVVRVLVVDDDEVMRMVCRRSFERVHSSRAIEVTEAGSGEAAIALLREREFDCVISDYRMGAVTGIEVLAFAMQHRPRAVRIMMSGFGSADLVKAALSRARIHEFIEKPMTTDEIEAVLRGVVVERYLDRLGFPS